MLPSNNVDDCSRHSRKTKSGRRNCMCKGLICKIVTALPEARVHTGSGGGEAKKVYGPFGGPQVPGVGFDFDLEVGQIRAPYQEYNFQTPPPLEWEQCWYLATSIGLNLPMAHSTPSPTSLLVSNFR